LIKNNIGIRRIVANLSSSYRYTWE